MREIKPIAVLRFPRREVGGTALQLRKQYLLERVRQTGFEGRFYNCEKFQSPPEVWPIELNYEWESILCEIGGQLYSGVWLVGPWPFELIHQIEERARGKVWVTFGVKFDFYTIIRGHYELISEHRRKFW